jgi:hypothetical protein
MLTNILSWELQILTHAEFLSYFFEKKWNSNLKTFLTWLDKLALFSDVLMNELSLFSNISIKLTST